MNLTDKRLKEILNSMTIIIDTREQQNLHIDQYLDSIGIKHISRCLKFADYSFEIPIIPELGNTEPISFENSIVIEKKNSLDEISGNLVNSKDSDNRERFERELQKSVDAKAKFIIMIENQGGWKARKLLEDFFDKILKTTPSDSLIGVLARNCWSGLMKVFPSANGWESILEHDYDTDFNPTAFSASLFAFREKYNIHIDFIPKKLAGFYIYSCFKYHLRNYIKNLEVPTC